MNILQKLLNTFTKQQIPGEGVGLSRFYQWSVNPNPWATRDYLAQYSSNYLVHTCVSAIAKEVAKIDFVEKKYLKTGLRVETDSRLVRLLDRPNSDMSGYQMIMTTTTHLKLVGEAFWFMSVGEQTRRPKEIYILRPDLIEIVLGDRGEVIGYILKSQDNTEKIPLSKDEVIHFKYPNPENPYRGLGIIEGLRKQLQIDDSSTDYTYSYFKNNATPPSVVNVKTEQGTIGKEDFEKLQQKWRDRYGGTGNAGKTAFVRNSELTVTRVGSDFDKIQFTEVSKKTQDDILMAFQVPRIVLGMVEGVNYNNAKTSDRVFAKQVIDPDMWLIVDTLNVQLMPRYTSGDIYYELDYVSPIPEMPEERIEYNKSALNAWLTVNEVREREGLAPIEGGDVMYQPINLVPTLRVTKSAPKAVVKRITKKDDEQNKLEYTYEQKEDFRLIQYGLQENYEAKMQDAMALAFKRLEKQTIDRLKGKKAVDPTGIAPTVSDVVDEIGDEYIGLALELIRDQGELAASIISDEATFTITQAERDLVDARMNKFASYVGEQLSDEVGKVMVAAAEQNLTIQQTAKKMTEMYSEFKTWRSERIARTETTYLSNEANVIGWKQTGFIQYKEWFTNPGACEYCQALNGKVIGIDEVFVADGGSIEGVDGGSLSASYGSIGHPPAHPNCRCTTLPVRRTI